MVRHNIRMVVAFCAVTVLVAWIALLISFWLPDPAGVALQATAFALGIPGLVVGLAGVVFETELTDIFETRGERAKTTHPLRCTDCGSKILNAAGTTVGDQIESELMIEGHGGWRPPSDKASDPAQKRKY